jgi:hypothetical protein
MYGTKQVQGYKNRKKNQNLINFLATLAFNLVGAYFVKKH